MKKDNEARYGSSNWFISEYDRVNDDPWGLSWRPSQKVRYARILSLLDALESPPSSILDIGCATGDFMCLLTKKYGQKCSVIGIDFVVDAIDRARTKYPQIHFRVGSIFDIGRDYAGQMDLVTCLEVLYYLERNECSRALRSIKESLCPGGHVIFSSLISKLPYFTLNELKNLVSTEFSLMKTETIHVKLLSIGERIILKLDKLGRKIVLFKNANLLRNIFKAFPFQAADFIEKYRDSIGDFSASHALVLAKKM